MTKSKAQSAAADNEAAPPLQHDPKIVWKFLSKVVRPNGGYVTMTAIHPFKTFTKTKEDGSTYEAKATDTFTPMTRPQDQSFVEDWVKGKKGWNLYYSLNEPAQGLRNKAKKKDIATIHGVYIDVDPRNGHDLTTEKERLIELAKAFLGDELLPATYAIASGNGIQVAWLLDEPLATKGNAVSIAEGIGRAIGKTVEGDSVFNVDRLLRLPGTVNHPDAGKIAKGRAAAMARVIGYASHRYSTTDLAAIYPADMSGPSGRVDDSVDCEWSRIDGYRNSELKDIPEDLRARLDHWLDVDETFARRWGGDATGFKKDSGSNIALGLCTRLKGKGCTATEIGILLLANAECNGHPTDQRDLGRMWNHESSRDKEEKVPAEDVFFTDIEIEWTDEMRADEARILADRAANDNASDNTGSAEESKPKYKAVSDWAGMPVPVREWLVPGWIPLGCTTALYGAGGDGKSLVAMQLQAAVATGGRWLGMETMKAPSLGWYAEDDDAELQRRFSDIASAQFADLADMTECYVESFVGAGQTLVNHEREGAWSPSKCFKRLHSVAKATKAKLVVVDNIAQFFSGNENSRHDVTVFVGVLNKLASMLNIAVVLVGHVGKGEGSEYSGSTAWNAAVRSRLMLGRRQIDGKKSVQSDVRVLSVAKSNYAGTGTEVNLSWRCGVFVAEGDRFQDDGSLANKEQRVEADFLVALRDILAKGLEPAFLVQSGDAYAPKLILQNSSTYWTADELGVAMRTLLNRNEVVLAWGEGPPSKRKKVLVPADHPWAKTRKVGE